MAVVVLLLAPTIEALEVERAISAAAKVEVALGLTLSALPVDDVIVGAEVGGGIGVLELVVPVVVGVLVIPVVVVLLVVGVTVGVVVVGVTVGVVVVGGIDAGLAAIAFPAAIGFGVAAGFVTLKSVESVVFKFFFSKLRMADRGPGFRVTVTVGPAVVFVDVGAVVVVDVAADRGPGFRVTVAVGPAGVVVDVGAVGVDVVGSIGVSLPVTSESPDTLFDTATILVSGVDGVTTSVPLSPLTGGK